MELKMSGTKVEEKPKAVLFYISQSLFKNKRLKRRLAGGKTRKKCLKKRVKPKPKKETNGHTTNQSKLPQETIELISSEEEEEETSEQPEVSLTRSEVDTSIVLSSDNEDEKTTQARIFPMLPTETTVQTAVGNAVLKLSLTQLKEKLDKIRKKKKSKSRISKRLNMINTCASEDLSISLISDDEENNIESPTEA